MSWNSSGLCSRSVLEVDEVPDDKGDFVSKSVKSMCGSLVPEPFVVTARAIVIRFYSGIFYPRPHDGVGGFRLAVQTRPVAILPPPPRTLKVGEILTIILGCILVLTICCFVCYIVKRHRLERRWILQREVMQQRLASHQRSCHEAANLTSMLTGLDIVRQTGLARPVGGVGGSSRACPPLPTEKKDYPDAPGGQYQPYRPALPPSLPRPPVLRQENAVGNEDELHLYMELEQLKMKDSGVCFLEQSACHSSSAGDTLRGGRPSANITLSDSCSCTYSACQACVSPCQGTASCHASRKPRRQTSTNLLTPAVNTASPTYICANAVTSVNAEESRASGSPSGDSKCHRPRGLSLSSLLYPKLSLSPSEARMPASLSSSCSRRRRHRSSHAENHSDGLLSPRNLAVMSHGKGGSEEASRGMRSQIMAFAKGDPHPRPQAFVEDASRKPHEPKAVEENHSRAASLSCEELERAQSSLESVFFSGDPDRRPWRRLVPCSDHALTPEGLHHSAHARQASRAQLSKSCGDVSPPADSTPPWGSLDVHRSDPSLPREALGARICPALRRVSGMFVGSSPFTAAPEEVSSPPPRPAKDAEGGKGVAWTPHAAFRSCFASSAHGFAPFKYNRFGVCGGGDDGASVAEESRCSEGVARP
ncbi:uncharacterized protein LOC125042458 [Penaeus chinensis]|uniref:uncharacterized protein LOC125042458 n=1 Tax=Penaeus chinensis TaxID=139456 RepID=UPI001FB7F4F3|nr:uncharacterized protein LOC125042458 [Penaeus chinensis]